MKQGFGSLPGRASAPRPAAVEPLWLEWLAFAGMLFFATWLLGVQGVWALLLTSDPTGLTFVIIVVFNMPLTTQANIPARLRLPRRQLGP